MADEREELARLRRLLPRLAMALRRVDAAEYAGLSGRARRAAVGLLRHGDRLLAQLGAAPARADREGRK
jgi:hypothetical protein